VHLETDRLIINNFNFDDLKFLTEMDADPLVRRFIDGKVKTTDETRQFLSQKIDSY
jgi:hypothetical protein